MQDFADHLNGFFKRLFLFVLFVFFRKFKYAGARMQFSINQMTLIAFYLFPLVHLPLFYDGLSIIIFCQRITFRHQCFLHVFITVPVSIPPDK